MMLALKKVEEEAPVIFREPIIYREWSHWLASLGRYALAIQYFEKTAQFPEVEDLRSFIGHCKALIRSTKYFEAEKLSTKCMTLDPDHYKALHMRVKALFQMGEFGYSLAHAYMGLQRHRMTFEHCVQQAIETVEDCIGRNTSTKALLLLYPWIQQLTEHRTFLITEVKEEKNDFLDDAMEETRFKVNDSEVQRHMRLKKLQRIIAEMYMGYLAIDKDFLQRIISHPEVLTSANKKSTSKLLALATTCFRNIVHLQDLLRMRRPIYVTLFKRREIPEGHKIMIEQERQLRRNVIVLQADFLLRYLHTARVNKEYIIFFRFFEHVKQKFDSYSDRMFPAKQKCLNALYKMVAWVYIDTRNLMCLDNEEMKTRYLQHHLGIRVATLPRDVDLAWMPTVRSKETLKVFRRRLAMASEPLELAWLHHELSKFFIDTIRFELARFYAKKGHDYAQQADCDQWILNFDHLMLRIEIHQNNRNEARDAAILALEIAKKLDIDCLIDFYERAVQAVDVELDVEQIGDFDDIAAREQLMLDLMPPEMKGEMDFLWRRMDVVPARRRLSVMPGYKLIDRKFKLPSVRRSILPSPPKDPEKEARLALLKQHVAPRKRPGFVDFEEFE